MLIWLWVKTRISGLAGKIAAVAALIAAAWAMMARERWKGRAHERQKQERADNATADQIRADLRDLERDGVRDQDNLKFRD